MCKHVIRVIGVALVVYIGVISILGSGATCQPPREWVECRFGEYKCCLPEEPCCLGVKGRYSHLSQAPRPDLSYTSLDGLVDYGTSTLKVEAADGDTFETKLKGRVAIVGGVCPEAKCPMQVVLAELRPTQDNLTSADGRLVSGVFVRNANTWTGSRLSDNSITMDSIGKLAIEATVDGEYGGTIVNATDKLEGALYYNVKRLTDTGTRLTNLIRITGNFADEDISVSLTIRIWATNCQPVVQPSAQCRPNIEHGFPGYVHFDSDFEMLENLQTSQDLCDALLAPKYEDVCTPGGTGEFPTFTCKTQPLPSSNNKVEVAKLLKFRWQDANGTVFSNKESANLDQMPVFPVTLTVANKWGKTVSATLNDAPVCSPDVPLVPGACAWERVFRSHQQGQGWCPEGSFLTALDLEGDRNSSAHDAPLVGYARCCAPQEAQYGVISGWTWEEPAQPTAERSYGVISAWAGEEPAQPIAWGSCSWVEVGGRQSHEGGNWCPANAFLTALDLDSVSEASAHDSPIVGRAQCCTPAASTASEGGVCSWVEVGWQKSHYQDGNWCPANAFLTALDLDSVSEASAHDSPIVGRAQCCGLVPPSPGDSCGVGQVYDCVGKCVDEATAEAWVGDGYCDLGTWGINLMCTAFSNDDGDCSSLLESLEELPPSLLESLEELPPLEMFSNP
jgi:hypothetical protein